MSGRSKYFFGLLMAAATLLVTREPLMFAVDLALLKRNRAPHPGEIDRLLKDGRRRDRVLDALWESGRLPHREAVILYLKRATLTDRAFVIGRRDMLLEAVADPDQSLRRGALTTLNLLDDSRWREAARWYLTEGDAGLVFEGLQRLRRAGDTNAVAEIAVLLEDTAPTTAVLAGITLASITGADLGIENGMGRRTSGMSEEAWLERQRATEAALMRARTWWRQNSTNWPAADPNPGGLFASVPRPLPAMTLVDTEMAPVSTADLLGKPVVMFFFVTYCGGCQMMLPGVHSLRSELPAGVTLMAVSLDAVPDEHNHFVELNMEEDGHAHHGHGHGHDHAHAEAGPAPAEIAKVSAMKADRLVPGLKPYFDIDGRTTELLSAGEVPTVIILDEAGRLVRRLTGYRSREELLALLKHLFPGENSGNKPD